MLGTIEVVGDGGPAVPLPARLRHLLAALVVSHGQVVPAERLRGRPAATTRRSTLPRALHNLVSRLRRTLEAAGRGGSLRTRAAGYVLEVEHDAVDADRFERLVTGARARLRDDPLDAARQLDAAAALWRGAAYAEFGDEEFVRPESARLAALRAGASEDRVDADLSGAARRGRSPARADGRRGPAAGARAGQLMLARYRVGQQAAALDAYGRYAHGWTRLGLEPSAAMRDLQSAVLRHDPRLGSPRGARAAPGRAAGRGGDEATQGRAGSATPRAPVAGSRLRRTSWAASRTSHRHRARAHRPGLR